MFRKQAISYTTLSISLSLKESNLKTPSGLEFKVERTRLQRLSGRLSVIWAVAHPVGFCVGLQLCHILPLLSITLTFNTDTAMYCLPQASSFPKYAQDTRVAQEKVICCLLCSWEALLKCGCRSQEWGPHCCPGVSIFLLFVYLKGQSPFSFFKDVFLFMCICAYVHMCVATHRWQKRALDHLDLTL